MPENEVDPGPNTQQFRAFVEERQQRQQGRPTGRAVLVAAAIALLVAVVLVSWLLLT